MASDSKAPVMEIPDAPKHLSAPAKKQWQDKYAKAHAQARIDHPQNASAQRTVATKSANTLLAVPAPASADEIDKLEDWQVIRRETRSHKDGSKTRVCVTSDGKKYAHPVAEAAPAAKPEAPKAPNSGK